MNASLYLGGAVLAAAARLSAASITGAEYYFNTDPGPGNGTPIPVTAAASVRMVVDVPPAAIASLPDGIHFLVCRVRDAEGDWSVAFSRPVHKQTDSPSPSARSVVAAEFYLNSDPGPGNGTPIPLTAAGSVRQVVNIPPATIAALPDGVHFLVVRVKDDEGNWSVAFSRPVHKEDPVVTDPRLARVDYQWQREGSPTSAPVPLTPEAGAMIGAWMPEIPLPAGGNEGETWKLILTAYDTEGAYCVPQGADVKLLDQGPSLEEVLAEAFPDAPPEELAPEATRPGETLTNVEKYYFGYDPATPTGGETIGMFNPLDFPGTGPVGPPRPRPWESGFIPPLSNAPSNPVASRGPRNPVDPAPIILRYTRNRYATNVTGVLEASTTLAEGSWQEAPATTLVIPNNAYTDEVIVRPDLPEGDGGRQFYRIRITRGTSPD